MFGMCNSCHRLQPGEQPSDTIRVNIIPIASTDCCAEPEQRLQLSQHVIGEEVKADDVRVRQSPERPTLLTHEAGMKTSAAHRKTHARGQSQWSGEEVLSRTEPPPPPVPRPPRVPPQPPEQMQSEEPLPQQLCGTATCDGFGPVDSEDAPVIPPRNVDPRQLRGMLQPRAQVQLAQQTANPLQRSRSIRERTDELEEAAAELLSCDDADVEAEEYQLDDGGDADLDQQQPILATLCAPGRQSGRRSSRALLGELYRPPALEPLDEVSSEIERAAEADTMRSVVACGSRTFVRPSEDRCPPPSVSSPLAAEAGAYVAAGDLATSAVSAARTLPHPSSAQGENLAKQLPPDCHDADPGEPTLLDAPVVKLRPSCFRIACRCVFGGRRPADEYDVAKV